MRNPPKTIDRLYFILVSLILLLSACSSFEGEYNNSENVLGQVAFCGKRDASERFDIYLYDFDTGILKNLSEDYVGNIDNAFGNNIGCDNRMRPYGVQGLSWSPDGTSLAMGAGGPYFTEAYIMKISPDGVGERPTHQWPRPWPELHIFENPIEYAWAPNEKNIAFIGEETSFGGYASLFIGDVSNWEKSDENTFVMQLTKEYREFPGVTYAPSWAPDGKLIAVSINGPSSGLMILHIDGSQEIHITENTSDTLSKVQEPFPWPDFPATKPSWAANGKKVIFVAANSSESRTSLFQVDRDGNNLSTIVSNNVWNPVYSPDGNYIAYIEYSGDEERSVGKIIRISPYGNERNVLATLDVVGLKNPFKTYYIRDLSWSPDGKWLTFTSNVNGSFQLYLLPADGNVFEQIIKFPGDAVYPQWRPNNSP